MNTPLTPKLQRYRRRQRLACRIATVLLAGPVAGIIALTAIGFTNPAMMHAEMVDGQFTMEWKPVHGEANMAYYCKILRGPQPTPELEVHAAAQLAGEYKEACHA